jgi:ABC-type lipoprotein export system ATPase subunit
MSDGTPAAVAGQAVSRAAPAGLPEKIIEARCLVKSFGQTPALRGASLAVRPGEILAVMGPSGSGKSTLLHCLAGILTPEQGEVWFGGQRLDTLSDDRRGELRRDRFGFVFQSGQLVPELTAEENVALPLLFAGQAAERTRTAPAGQVERSASVSVVSLKVLKLPTAVQTPGDEHDAPFRLGSVPTGLNG